MLDQWHSSSSGLVSSFNNYSSSVHFQGDIDTSFFQALVSYWLCLHLDCTMVMMAFVAHQEALGLPQSLFLIFLVSGNT